MCARIKMWTRHIVVLQVLCARLDSWLLAWRTNFEVSRTLTWATAALNQTVGGKLQPVKQWHIVVSFIKQWAGSSPALSQHYKSDLPEGEHRSSEQLWQRNFCRSMNQSKLMTSRTVTSPRGEYVLQKCSNRQPCRLSQNRTMSPWPLSSSCPSLPSGLLELQGLSPILHCKHWR